MKSPLGANASADPDSRIDAVKVFSATKAAERERLGDRITAWLSTRPKATLVKHAVRQSSDASFHCLSIVVFLRDYP